MAHPDVAKDKSMVKKAVHKHEKTKHPGEPLTKLKKGGMPKAMMGKLMMQKKAGRGR
jgi:hypothetical protein